MMRIKFLMVVSVIILSCNSGKNRPIFAKAETNGEFSEIFILDFSSKSPNQCRHELKFWLSLWVNDQAYPFLHWNGTIDFEGEKVFFNLNDGNRFKYLDFGMNVSQVDTIFNLNDTTLDKRNIRHMLTLEEKFFDSNLCDTIYKFRLSGLKIITRNNDLVMYLSKDYGLSGIYVSKIYDNVEEVYDSRGETYIEKSKYKRVPAKKRLL